MHVRITEKSRVLIELPMSIFLRLADGDGKMTAREMERFDALLQETTWCRSPLLQRALANTEAEKAALWKQYIEGTLRADIGHVVASLDTVLSSIPLEQRPGFEGDLTYFALELRNAAHRSAGLFRSDLEAEITFSTLSDLIQRPSARTRVLNRSDAPAEPKPSWSADGGTALLLSDPAPELVWQGGKTPLRCVQVVDETHDTKTFHFIAEPPKLFRYHPGQFLTFEIPFEGQTVRRSYTISSSPSRPYSVAVTIKRLEEGVISNWFHQTVTTGMLVFADGPNGKFTCIDGDGGPYLFMSGGSGITPAMSMMRWLCDTSPGVDIHFVYAAKTANDIIFEQELRLMERQLHSFRCDLVLSRAENVSAPGVWTGRISRELLSEIVPDLHDRAVYLCGPVPFMEAVSDSLAQLNFDMARFRQESFGGLPRPKTIDAKANTAAKIVFSASDIEIDCKGSDYILDLALEHGIDAAFSCRAGQCGSCKVVLLEGAVVHDCADALDRNDVDVVLACQARPVGRVVLDL